MSIKSLGLLALLLTATGCVSPAARIIAVGTAPTEAARWVRPVQSFPILADSQLVLASGTEDQVPDEEP